MTDEEEGAFIEPEEYISSGEGSKLLGWVICNLQGHQDEIRAFQLRGVLTGRCLKNWAMALYFLKKVLTPIMTRICCMMCFLQLLAEGTIGIDECVQSLSASLPQAHASTTDPSKILLQTVDDLLQAAKGKFLIEVIC